MMKVQLSASNICITRNLCPRLFKIITKAIAISTANLSTQPTKILQDKNLTDDLPIL
ncbi:hypothetical protein F7734_12185 [Scytonema sp. UIC 10036]|uniref:hypothetical protein n=1 Tax=Scytonema sp. UIC 10036 TaxID=2304196 RepID=UPI0012DA17CF|nr:hypothetical protein [Scytonema sp. UIC 10036]MUG93148.1 hypothetical protein [Scytonema sp. UIC 10036]